MLSIISDILDMSKIVRVGSDDRPAGGPARAENGMSAERALAARFGGVRVLLAEDDVVNQEVIGAYLSAVGLRVDVVGDGRQAVERVRAGG